MTSAEPLPNTSVCPGCGAGLRCGNIAGDANCWCSQLPHIMPVPAARVPLAPASTAATAASVSDQPAASCYCPACLKKITHDRLNAA